MAEGKKSWRQVWDRAKRFGKWVLIITVIGLMAMLGWRYWPAGGSNRPMYDVYVTTNYSGEDRDATAAEIQKYVNKRFPPDEYEYVGIIAQSNPSSRSSTTTTYVLFKRK